MMMKYIVVLDSGPLVPWYENTTSSTKPKVDNLPSEDHPSHGHAYRNGEDRPSGFRGTLADRQTDMFMTILPTPQEAK